MITEKDFIDAGFVKSDDPQYIFEYSLAEQTTEPDEDCKPAILFDRIMSQFCITDGELIFIYFNADTPKDAVEWASRITNFDIN